MRCIQDLPDYDLRRAIGVAGSAVPPNITVQETGALGVLLRVEGRDFSACRPCLIRSLTW